MLPLFTPDAGLPDAKTPHCAAIRSPATRRACSVWLCRRYACQLSTMLPIDIFAADMPPSPRCFRFIYYSLYALRAAVEILTFTPDVTPLSITSLDDTLPRRASYAMLPSRHKIARHATLRAMIYATLLLLMIEPVIMLWRYAFDMLASATRCYMLLMSPPLMLFQRCQAFVRCYRHIR